MSELRKYKLHYTCWAADMTMYRLILAMGIMATIVCAHPNQRIVGSSDPVIGKDGSNAVLTNTDKMATKDNRDKGIDNDVIIKNSNHSCLHMEILSCECSPLTKVNSELSVNCSNRNLSRVPENIPPNTVVLFLSENKIKNISSGVFENLAGLRYLDLSSNELDDFKDVIFTGLRSLDSLYLQNNPFNLYSSQFDENVFSPLTNLRTLNLKSSNQDKNETFQYPDKALGKLQSLETLIIDGLNNGTFGEGFQNMTSLRTLDLSVSPKFTFIPVDAFRSFQNIPVTNLFLNHCNLIRIHPEALRYFPQIDTINYSFNTKLEIKGVGKSFLGLQNTTIRKVIMQRVHAKDSYTSFTKEDIIHLRDTKLEEFYVEYNNLAFFDNDALSHFPSSMKIGSASWNMLQTNTQQMEIINFYKNLTELKFSYQQASYQNSIHNYDATETQIEFPYTNGHIIHFPNITDVSTGSTINSFDPVKGYPVNFPPKLWSIQCSNTYKLKLMLPKITFNNASLTHADFSYNLICPWQGPFHGLEKLTHLNLSGNNCDNVSSQFFAFLPNLQTLRIGRNRFGPVLLENTFYNLTSLQILDMHRNIQENTRLALFSRLVDLRELDISTNYLTSWEADISRLVNLSLLNLTDNKLSTLPKTLRDDLDEISQLHMLEVDISGNPLKCTCDTKEFVLWFTTTKVKFVNLTSTLCSLENDTNLSLTRSNDIFKYLRMHCRTYTILISVTSPCVGLSLVILIGFAVHRSRWKIRYLLYVTLNRKQRTGYERLESNLEDSQYFFDAFISYEDGSRKFVVDEIIPRLETEIGMKLCIDKRDFVPGLFVTDNIMHAIRNSRKTVVLLTKGFMESKWCMYELNMARMEALYNGRQSLVTVVLEDIPSKSLPRDILDLFRQKTYIEMVGNKYGASLFWNRVISAISKDD